MIELADLSELQFLKHIKTLEQYESLVNGPYRVGRVIAQDVFTSSIGGHENLGGHIIWHRMTDFDGLFSRPHRDLINQICLIDIALGFSGRIEFGDYDQSAVDYNSTQRAGSDTWHKDNGGKIFDKTQSDINLIRTYIVASCIGTEYVREEFTRDLEQHPAYGFTNTETVVETMSPFDIYLVPRGVFHRAQSMESGTKRSFLRLILH
jgi:hypothetical protein